MPPLPNRPPGQSTRRGMDRRGTKKLRHNKRKRRGTAVLVLRSSARHVFTWMRWIWYGALVHLGAIATGELLPVIVALFEFCTERLPLRTWGIW